jgi:hypothetical protein
MKYELWHSESDGSYMLFLEGNRSAHEFKKRNARVIWTIEANTYKEALGKHDIFLGLSELQPGRSEQSASRELTTRVTVVMYLDEDGTKRFVEVPGWVGVIPRLARAKLSFSTGLGQVYVERPYCDLANTPGEITMVELRSADGMRRMFQELPGRIDDKGQISELVHQRLGANMSRWRIIVAHVPEQLVWWKPGEVYLVDQRPLPFHDEVMRCTTIDELVYAIRSMQGGRIPAIAGIAGYAMALVAWEQALTNNHGILRRLYEAKTFLDVARPSDSDLAAATKRICDAADAFHDANSFPPFEWASPKAVSNCVLEEAHSIAAAIPSAVLVQHELFGKLDRSPEL